MHTHSETYAAFQEKQLELASLLEEASEQLAILEMDTSKNYLWSLSEKVKSDSFKVLVVGTFKNGKSTFINSFLGKEVLPAFARPCTAVINEIIYGEEPGALLHFRSEIPEELPTSLPEPAQRHLDKYGRGEIPPMEIREDEIEQYVVIPKDKDAKETMFESPYQKLVLSWPLELLKNGVEIVDSPGLNEHKNRTDVTYGYLHKADAILMVLAADKLCAQDEMEFIEDNLKKRNFSNVYFIVNRFDQMRTETDREDIRELAQAKLGDYTAFGENGLHFVSARDALDGKLDDNSHLFLKSGMPEFEGKLANFLVNDRGRAKLTQPLKELERVLEFEALKNTIPQLRGMLESSLEELVARREAAIPKLEKLRASQEHTKQNIGRQIENAIPDIRFHINKFFTDLNTNIEAWVDEFEPTTEIGIMDIPNMKVKTEIVIKEYSEEVLRRIEIEQRDWQDNTLVPLIENKISDIFAENQESLKNFFMKLDEIKVSLSGIEAPESSNVTLGERLLAAGAGFVATGFSGATLGGLEGFNKNFVKGILTQLALIIGGIAVLGLNPFLVIGAVLALTIFKSGLNIGEKILNQIKPKIVEEIQTQVNNSAVNAIERLLDGLKRQLWEGFDPFLKGMDAEMQEVENQVNRVIEEMRQGEAETNRQKELLYSCQEKIENLLVKANDFAQVNL